MRWLGGQQDWLCPEVISMPAMKKNAGEQEVQKSEMLSLKEGEYLIHLARKAAATYAQKHFKIEPEIEKGVLGKDRGVFVTIELYPSHDLRGCIGYPMPVAPLARSVIDNAINAAFQDPRFPSMSSREFAGVVFEVSVLTVPKKIDYSSPGELASKVKIGRDGLIVKSGFYSGLLLPQVPVEWKWNEREFLSATCEKAGLPSDYWQNGKPEFQSFQAQIFAEEKPEGRVIEKPLA